MAPVGRPARVGQKDDRRLEALARMDGQHPHALAFGLHVALDRRVGRLDLGEKEGERGRLAPLVVERQRQELVDRIGCVGPEPRKQRLPASPLAEQARVKGVGRQGPRPVAPDREPMRSLARALRRSMRRGPTQAVPGGPPQA